MAAFIASSAKTEQCIFTGGRDSSFAISTLDISSATSIGCPFTSVVIKELEAIAEPQPKVLNFASSMIPESLILSCSLMTSPQAGAPTKPVPTDRSSLSRVPTF